MKTLTHPWSRAALALGASAVMLALISSVPAGPVQSEEKSPPVRRAHYLMGTIFEITAHGAERATTIAAVEEAFQAIRRADEILSHYRPESELSRLNRPGAREAVTVSPELYQVLDQSLRFARLSGGAFDVTIGPLLRLWEQAAERNRLPSATELDAARARVGSANLELLAHSQVRLLREDLEINFGAIGKGWAVDQALAVLRAHGIENAFLSAGTSTVYALGDDQAGGEGWTVGVRDPLGASDATIATLRLRNAALSTSASYELYSEIEGRRYSHLIDPRDGRPIEPMLSASVIAPTATAADALSTAAYVLGMNDGANLLRRLGREGLLVARGEDGSEPILRWIRRNDSSLFEALTE